MKETAYQIKQEHFEGPLDLLLDLIESEKLSISAISLAEVAEKYLLYVKNLESIDQEALAEFLVVASQLMFIKSRSLLPELKLTDEEEASIEDLELRLKIYQQVREAAKLLKEKEHESLHLYARESFQGLPVMFYPPKKLSLAGLLLAFDTVLKTIPQVAKLTEEKMKRVVSLEETIRSIHSRLTARLEHVFSEMVKGSREKIEVIVAFLAILELAKQKLVSLEQHSSFSEIKIKKLP